MRIAKIESDNIIQTPKAPLRNQSIVNFYGSEEQIGVEATVNLVPQYSVVSSPESNSFFQYYDSVSIPYSPEEIDVDDSNLRDEAGIELTVVPGTADEEHYSFSDWNGLESSLTGQLKDLFSHLIDEEKKVFTEDLYQMALDAEEADSWEVHELLHRMAGGREQHQNMEDVYQMAQDYNSKDHSFKQFEDWTKQLDESVYQTLVKNTRPGGVNEFEERGAFSDWKQQLSKKEDYSGEKIMQGSRQVDLMEQQAETQNDPSLKIVEGILVPADDELVQQYLRGFSR